MPLKILGLVSTTPSKISIGVTDFHAYRRVREPCVTRATCRVKWCADRHLGDRRLSCRTLRHADSREKNRHPLAVLDFRCVHFHVYKG